MARGGTRKKFIGNQAKSKRNKGGQMCIPMALARPYIQDQWYWPASSSKDEWSLAERPSATLADSSRMSTVVFTFIVAKGCSSRWSSILNCVSEARGCKPFRDWRVPLDPFEYAWLVLLMYLLWEKLVVLVSSLPPPNRLSRGRSDGRHADDGDKTVSGFPSPVVFCHAQRSAMVSGKQFDGNPTRDNPDINLDRRPSGRPNEYPCDVE
jgi:hypothetical protein